MQQQGRDARRLSRVKTPKKWSCDRFLGVFTFRRHFSVKDQKALISTLLCRKALLVMALLLVPGGVLFSAFSGRAQVASAAPSTYLSFQARLLTNTGNLVPDGYYNIEFKLFNASTSSGSTQGTCTGDAACEWVETYYDSNGVTAGNDNRVRVQNGYFNVRLGSLTAFSSSIDWTQQKWITMNIGGSTQTATPTYDGEMSPRIQLTAVPLAFTSNNVNSGNTSTASTNSANTILQSGHATGATSNTGTITLQSGNATSGNSGNITIDAGTASGTKGTISIAATNASALTLGNTSGTSLMTGSTLTLQSAANIVLGTSDTTGTLLVLDTKTGAGDPTGANGGMYYNSNSSKFRCYEGGSWKDCVSLFTDAGTQTYLTATTDELVVGSSSSFSAKLSVIGTSDQEQLLIRAYSSQAITNPLILAQDSTGTELFRLSAPSASTIVLGDRAGSTLASSTDSVYIGSQVGSNNTTSDYNTAVGSNAFRNGSGSDNSIFGSYAGNNLGGGNANTLIGSDAGYYLSSGSASNVVVGSGAAASIVTGTMSNGTIIGTGAGALLNGGDNNVLLGYQAGNNITSGDNNIIIGYDIDAASATGSSQLNIGGLLQSTNYATGNLTIGTSDTTGQLLVLDTKTGSGDPTGANGGMYYNSNSSKFRCYEGGAWKDCVASGTGFIQNGTAAQNGANFNIQSTGTANVTAKIRANTSQTADLLQVRNSGDTTSLLAVAANGDVTIDGTTLTVDATNNFVGIRDAAPVSPLTVAGGMTFYRGNAIMYNGHYTSGDIYLESDSAFQIWHDITNDKLKLQAAAVGTQGNSITYVDGLTISTDGTLTVGASNTTGTLLVLDTKTGAGDPTGVNGGMYYNSNAAKFRCYQNGAWADCIGAGGGSTLQGAYTSSTGSTTPEIILDATRNGLDIQDANTTIGATQALLAVRASGTSSTLGTGLFVVNASGRVGIKTGSTSTTPTLSYDLSFGQDSTPTARTIGVEAQATSATAGNALTVSSGAGNTSGAGGLLTVQSGAGGTTGAGGALTVQAGSGGATSGAGGLLTLQGGNATAGASAGGGVTINSGTGFLGGAGGALQITVGASGTQTAASTAGTTGAAFTLTGATGGSATGTGVASNGATGGAITIQAGNGGTTVNGVSAGSGGTTIVKGGTVGGSGATGGILTLNGGSNGGAGGAVTLLGGTSNSISTGGTVTIQGGPGGSGPGGAVTIQGGTAAGTNRAGGNVSIVGGTSIGTGAASTISITSGSAVGATIAGGALTVTSGAGNTSGAGGLLSVVGGAGGSSGVGGGVTLTTGAGGSTSGNSGALTLQSGNVTSGTAGNVTFDVGTSTTGAPAISIGDSTNSTGKTITVGGSTQTGQITVGKSTATNTIAIGNGATGAGNTQTINIGATNNASTGVTAITIGNSNSSTGVNTVKLFGSTTATSGGVFATLKATGGSTAICADSLANATNPTAGTAYELSDCSATPVADYAEMYPAEAGLEVGDVISQGTQQIQTYNTDSYGKIDWNNPKGAITQVVKATDAYSPKLMGIISDNYSDFTSTGNNIKPEDNPMSVALVGRVLVKISTENGVILPGDFLTASATMPGYAMKATDPGYVIGQALNGYSNPTPGLVMVYVRNEYFPGTQQGVYLQNGNDAAIANLTVTGNVDIASNLNVSGQTTLQNLTVNGQVTAVNVTVTQTLSTQTLIVTGNATVQGNLTVEGDTVVHKITVNGKIVTAGNTPVVAPGIAAGLGGALGATVIGNDTAGTISVHTGNNSITANELLAQITFDSAYDQAPIITLTPTSEDAASLKFFLIKSNTGWSIKALNLPLANKVYSFDYHIIQ